MYSAIDNIIDQVLQEQRSTLLEPEVYQILSYLGLETPIFHVMESIDSVNDEILARIPGEKVVVKLVSPQIFRSEAGLRTLIPHAAKSKRKKKKKPGAVHDRTASG